MSKAYLAAVMMLGVAAWAPRAQAQNYSTPRTLPSGTKVVATLDNEISSGSNKIGDTVSATINSEVKDNAGQVIFPVGSKAEVRIIDIKSADPQHRDGTLAMAVTIAAAASIEAARHLRSAIELAESNSLPDLYQRLGELSESGERVVDAYQTALRLCREQGRPAVQQLQILAGLLGCGLRRSEVAALTFGHVQQRDGRLRPEEIGRTGDCRPCFRTAQVFCELSRSR